MNKERLLNVAKALRESPKPERFHMGAYTSCGTPICAFGHYVLRSDLQDAFQFESGEILHKGEDVVHSDACVLEHFGFSTTTEASQFFGCKVEAQEERENGFLGPFLVDHAETALQAAEFIERLVAEQG